MRWQLSISSIFFSILLILLYLTTSYMTSEASTDTRVTDRILSFGVPSLVAYQDLITHRDPRYEWGERSGRSMDVSTRSRGVADGERLTYSSTNGSEVRTSGHNHQLLPGSISLKPMGDDRIKIASTGPGPNSAGWESSCLVDSVDRLEKVGKLVGDPIDLYSNFQIEVEKAKYSVKLYGMTDDGRKTVLFSCKAGLGSSEYPTPKGSFYISRIFDNKPLWIPPQDRDWAYGQAASHSVYGGRMMPFFSKVQAAPPPKNDDINSELDTVSPLMKMVDTGTYRIHGTDSPWSVGSAQSHGCVRLLNSAVAQLADTLKMYVGTTTRGETPNGVYISLARPVRIVLH